jgi:cytochrome c oxidase cbb3-type subunit III
MRVRSINFAIGITALSLLSILGGCKNFQGGSTATGVTKGLPSEGMIASVPLGQLAGEPSLSVAALSITNPYEGNPQAVQQGKELYVRMNCAGCHAYNGKGNMGPDLTDAEWRYGGLPVQIYKSIRDGRPQGMPAWGVALPPEDIWKLVAYIQSLGGTVSPKDYEHARQGDQPGEQVAPEAQADAQLAPVPPATEITPVPAVQTIEPPGLGQATVPGTRPATPVVPKRKAQRAEPKIGEPQP